MWLISLKRTPADTTTILFLCTNFDGRRFQETSFWRWLADGSFLFAIVGLYVHARLLCAATRRLRGSVLDTGLLKWKGAGRALRTHRATTRQGSFSVPETARTSSQDWKGWGVKKMMRKRMREHRWVIQSQETGERKRTMVTKSWGSERRSSLRLMWHDLHPPRHPPRRLVERRYSPPSWLQLGRSDWQQRPLGWGQMLFGSWVASGRGDTSPGRRAISSDSQRGRNDCTAWSRHCSCPRRSKHRHTCNSGVDLTPSANSWPHPSLARA